MIKYTENSESYGRDAPDLVLEDSEEMIVFAIMERSRRRGRNWKFIAPSIEGNAYRMEQSLDGKLLIQCSESKGKHRYIIKNDSIDTINKW